MSFHQAFLTAPAPLWQSPVSVLRYGHGAKNTADETEDEQVQTGSRLRLQTGAGLPQGNNMPRYAGCMLRYSRFTEKHVPTVQYTVCMAALCIGHMAHFVSSQACTHTHISIILCMCIDVCIVYVLYTHRQSDTNVPKQVNTPLRSKVGKHRVRFNYFLKGQFTQICLSTYS